jgi:hypothetical protein
MDGEINLVAIANGKLEVALNDAKAALKKKRKSWYKDLSKTLVVIGACAFATFAAQGLMLAMGSTANLSAIPLSGGASLKLTIPIL